MKILILGHGGHGKDEFAKCLNKAHGLTFSSSSEFACKRAVFPTLHTLYGYKSQEECYQDRRNHRLEWKNLITEYNTADKGRLCREILEQNDMYVGMRCRLEFCATMELFDLIFWVQSDVRVGNIDNSMDIPFYGRSMIEIDNNGTKKHLQVIADKLQLDS